MTRLHSTIVLIILFFPFFSGCSEDNQSLSTWDLASKGVFSIAISPKFAVVGSVVAGTAAVWHFNEKNPTYIWQHGSKNPNGIISSAISADKNFAITAERNSLAWWRLNDGKLLGSWRFENIQATALSADGQFALVGLGEKAVYFALAAGKSRFAFPHNGAVNATALSLDGVYGLTGSNDRNAKLWQLASGHLAYTWQHQTSLSSVALSPKGSYAMTNAHLGETRIWETGTGKLKQVIGPKIMTVSAAAFSPDEKRLLTGHVSQRIDLWNIKSGEKLDHWLPKKRHVWRPTAATVVALQFTQTGKRFISASSNGYVQNWRIKR